MSDFIREVDEDYRRDRIIAFLTRYQLPLAALVVAIIVGAGVWRVWVDNRVATAEADNERYAAAEQLAKDGKTHEAEEAFAAIAKTGPAGYARLARLRAAALSAPEAAAKAYDAIANDDAVEGSIRDAARVRGAMLRVDSETPAAFEQRYGRFSSPGFGFHASMGELLAIAAMKRNDFKAAGGYLDAIIADAVAPPALRNRAQAFRALVTGGATTPMASPPPPAKVTPIAGSAAASPPSPPAAATPTPPPAAPPTAAAKPTPPAATPQPQTGAGPD